MTTEEREFSNDGRWLGWKLIVVWFGIFTVCGAVWGFSIDWIYPVVYRFLQRFF